MSSQLDLFRVERGIELSESVQIIMGNGAPGLAGDSVAAQVGSVYLDETGSLYYKILPGAGASNWRVVASESYVNGALGAKVSWREPAIVLDEASTTLPTSAPGSTIMVNGVLVSDGDRVLFAGIVGGSGKNVYVYSESSGTFTPDANVQSLGDAVYIQSGSAAGRTYVYNGTAWVLSDQATVDEEGFIRNFIGKGAVGSLLPTYGSVNYIAAGDSLFAALTKLDIAVGANVNVGNFVVPTNKIQANIQALDTEMGPNVSLANFVKPSATINANIQAVDAALGAQVIDGNYILASKNTNANIQAVDAALGAQVADGNFVKVANKINQNIVELDTEIGANVVDGGHVKATNTINGNIQVLDVELTHQCGGTSATNVTSVTPIDVVAGALAAKWIVHVTNAANPNNVYATEIYAITDGTNVQYSKYSTMKIGNNISGLSVSVDTSAGVLRLLVQSTAAVNVQARRVGVI